MVKITTFNTGGAGSFSCNALSLKNNGTCEVNVTFDGTNTKLSIQRGEIVYVFNSNSIVSDTYKLVFSDNYNTTNEFEVIETTYTGSPSPTQSTSSLTRIEERNVYVNINAEKGYNDLDLSKYVNGFTAFTYGDGLISMFGGYDAINPTVVAIQTKNCAPNIAGSVYGGWMDLDKVKGNNSCVTEFGLGTLNTDVSTLHEVDEGIFFRLDNIGEKIIIRSNNLGAHTIVPRNQWTDKLDGTGPSGVIFDFKTDRCIFYFEYIYSGNQVNVFLSFESQEILVLSIYCVNALFTNPRQQFFLRAKAPNDGDSFEIAFRGCSIYNCSNSIVPKNIACSSQTFQVGAEKYSTGFLNGYLGIAFARISTSIGYRFIRLKDFQVQSENNHPFQLLLVVDPIIISTATPPVGLVWKYPFGSQGINQPVLFADNYDGLFEINDYKLCVNITQHVYHSDLITVVNQFLGNEIASTAQVIAIMILPHTSNMKFRVSANLEEL